MREPFTIERAGGGGKAFVRGIGMLVLIGILVLVAFSSTSCVRTGHVGVVSVFGRVTGQTLPEGIHVVNPAAIVTELSVKTQEVKEHASVPSKEGLIMGLEASILYHLDPARAALCPRPLLVRMNASIRFIVWGSMPVGAFVGGVLGREIGVVPTLWLVVAGFLVAGLTVLFSPLSRMRHLPRQLDAHADA